MIPSTRFKGMKTAIKAYYISKKKRECPLFALYSYVYNLVGILTTNQLSEISSEINDYFKTFLFIGKVVALKHYILPEGTGCGR